MTVERKLSLREGKSLEPASDHAGSEFRRLLRDVEPFFHAKPVVYVDAGAHKGHTFREVYNSRLTLQAAHLIEPNPTSFKALEAAVRELGAEAVATCHNVALAAAPQRLRLQDADVMTKVVGAGYGAEAADGRELFDVEAVTLDALLPGLPQTHVSILKVDVEGYEREVFAGAATLLGAQAVDLIYVEAGMDPANTQQTYYRDIEDMLMAQGYRLFRIYEQKHEWTRDSPLLRRANLAFLSQAFTAASPYKLSHDLFAAQEECRALRESLKAAEAAQEAAVEKDRIIHDLRRQAAALEEARQALDAELRAEQVAARAARAAAQDKDDLIRHLHEQVAAHEKRQKALKAVGAAQTKAAEAARAEQKAARRDLAETRRYAADLERHLSGLLSSTTWRAMEPVRRIVQRVRRLDASSSFAPRLAGASATDGRTTGAAGPVGAPAPVAPKPSQAGARKAPAARKPTLAEQADQLLSTSSQIAVRDLVASERRWGGRSDSLDEFFLSKFARMLAYSRYASHSEVAKAVDAVREKIGPDLGWLKKRFSSRVVIRFTTVAASSLTRDHRYEEARQLVDMAIEEFGRRVDLLRYRAEMCWPHDLDQARADLAECARRGELPDNWAVFRAYLEWRAGALTPEVAATPQGERSQMGLVLALAALDRSDFDAYRTEMNAFFEQQGLPGPVPADAARFDFAALGSDLVMDREMAGPRVSVIMTTFNSAATVGYAARSILAQTHANLELFIVDDCSSDETPRLLAELAASDPRVRVLSNEANSGTYLSKNRAMEQAGGEYVTFHDSDDWAHPERLARHVQMMEADRELVASRSEWLRVTEQGEVRFHRWGHKFQHLNPASTFLRREVIEAIGYFDSVRYAADTEYWYRLWHRFGIERTKTLPLCLSLGAFHGASLTQSGTGAMGLENYSPVRGAYTASYLDWHATAAREALWRPSKGADRAFWAPSEMLVETGGPASPPAAEQASGEALAGPAPSHPL